MLKTRIITAIIALLLIAVVLFVLPPQYTESIIGLVLLGGAWEWSGFLGADNRAVRITYTTLIAVCLAGSLVLSPSMVTLVLEIACAWWIIAFFWTLRYPTPIATPIRWLCGVLVIVPMFVALVELLRLGVDYLVFTLLIVWLADGGAFFAGKLFGRVKLAPAISPGKTWEGVVGGMLLVTALAVTTALLRGVDVAVLTPFCLAVAVISIVGDLTVSMFKRTTGLKDSGTLFPGHGGVLDRIDSIAAAAPLFALGIAWLGLA